MIKTPQSIFEFGQKHASLYLGFSCFIFDQARKLEIDTVFFCTREGEFFKAVFDALFCSDGRSTTPIQTRLLEASRMSTFGPSLHDLSPDSLMRIWNQYSSQSPRSFLKTLNIPTESMARYFDQAGLPMDIPVDKPWSSETFRSVLSNEQFLRDANDYLAENRKTAVQYFESRFAGLVRIGMVDIGWRGSIQDNLALLFQQRTFFGCYLGISRFFNPQPTNIRKFAFGPDRNRSAENFDLLHAVDVLEMISNSPNGSVMSYQSEPGGEVTSVRKNNKAEDAAFHQFTVEFQQGVLSVAQSSNVDVLLSDYHEGVLRPRSLAAWRGILNDPSDQLVQAYFSLKHNEEFGTGEFHDKSVIPGISDLLRSFFSSASRSRIRNYARFSQWSTGALRRKDISVAQRVMSYLLIKAALSVKAFIHSKRFSSMDS